MRALVELSSRLGDLVADVAVLQSLANGLDNCTIEVVVSDIVSGIIEDCSFIHRRHSYSPTKFMGTLVTNIAAVSQEWDIFLQQRRHGVLHWSQPWLRATLHRQRPARGSASDTADNMWDSHLNSLEGLVPNYMDNLNTRIPLLDGRIAHAYAIADLHEGDRIMTVSPGSALGYLPWPERRVIEVVIALKKKFDRVPVLGRAANSILCQRVADKTGSIAVAGSMPFPYALGLISSSKFHIGSDNDMAQLAASYGVTTLCVGGPRNGYLKPWQQQIVGNPEGISVDITLDYARKLLQ